MQSNVWRLLCGMVLLIGLLASGHALAEKRISIVLSNQEWPPYMGQALPYKGILSRLVLEAFARGGVDVSYRFYPNNRTLQSARTGVVDGSFGWAPTEERKKDLLYTEPVMSAHMVFLQRNAKPVNWHVLQDLSPFLIGITLGNYYSDEFDRLQKAGVLHVDASGDDLSNLRKLLAGHIDLFPIDNEVGRYLLSHFFAEQAVQVGLSGQPFWQAPLHVVIWRKHPQAAELVVRFNRGLQILHDSGDFDRLLQETRVACLAGSAVHP